MTHSVESKPFNLIVTTTFPIAEAPKEGPKAAFRVPEGTLFFDKKGAQRFADFFTELCRVLNGAPDKGLEEAFGELNAAVFTDDIRIIPFDQIESEEVGQKVARAKRKEK
ncbi:MAG: hypothetical protein CSA26_03435 [Desulfobacterales bacterium]|nr:MAG: hypothetical protein CSA26_03435 [Desulfobacterales bacterium]